MAPSSSTPRSIGHRIIRSGFSWTGIGIGTTWIVPKAIKAAATAASASSAATLFVPTMITTVACSGGTIVVLMPLGLFRGVISSTIDLITTTGKESIVSMYSSTQKQLQPLSRQPTKSIEQEISKNISNTTNSTTKNEFLELLTMGGGWKGYMVRTLTSPFFPSTSQMMVRVQEILDRQQQQQQEKGSASSSISENVDSHVVAAAITGYLEGFLQDKKDTITIIGCFVYALIVGGGVGVDYYFQKANEKRKDFIASRRRLDNEESWMRRTSSKFSELLNFTKQGRGKGGSNEQNNNDDNKSD